MFVAVQRGEQPRGRAAPKEPRYVLAMFGDLNYGPSGNRIKRPSKFDSVLAVANGLVPNKVTEGRRCYTRVGKSHEMIREGGRFCVLPVSTLRFTL